MMRIYSYIAALFLSAALPQMAMAQNAPTGNAAAEAVAPAQAAPMTGAPVQAPLPEDAAQKALVERGHYLAVASDCTACHTAPGAANNGAFGGGYIFLLPPMGQIVSTNITPSKQYGIGNWSERDFARAVREGVRPNGVHLYPAMPYAEYSTLTDADIHALYAYFMQGVAPVNAAPKEQTAANFPFNLPGEMLVWNTLFLNKQRFEPNPKDSDLINRGHYLVDGPAHCGTCHTPRNFLMAAEKSRYLGGAELSGWWAPNITPDPVGGIGGWSEAELLRYLQTGHLRDKSQAAGPMAEAVEYSFRHMTDYDLRAIAAYLKTIPPLPTKGQTEVAYAPHKPINSSFTQYEIPAPGAGSPLAADSATANGALLYNTACAACHGANGQGADDGSSPSLLANRAVGSAQPNAAIMAVAFGVYRDGADGKIAMPGFYAKTTPIFAAMNEEQIAAVVNYVRGNFGHREDKIDAAQVKTILAGGTMPFLIEYAPQLAYTGIPIGLIVLLGLIYYVFFRRKKPGRAGPGAQAGHKAEAAAAGAAAAVKAGAEKAAAKTEAEAKHIAAKAEAEVKAAAEPARHAAAKAAAKAEKAAKAAAAAAKAGAGKAKKTAAKAVKKGENAAAEMAQAAKSKVKKPAGKKKKPAAKAKK